MLFRKKEKSLIEQEYDRRGLKKKDELNKLVQEQKKLENELKFYKTKEKILKAKKKLAKEKSKYRVNPYKMINF